MIRAACATGIGKRPNHEDNYLLNGRYLTDSVQKQMSEGEIIQYQSVCSRKVNLIAVSDGMGGHNAGEIASRICIERLAALENTVQNCNNLKQVIAQIQQEIHKTNLYLCNESNRNSELKGMGATLVLFVSFESEFAILNIGDSRAYYFDNDSLIQITKDHTEGQRLLDCGVLSRKELEQFTARKNLNRYMGYGASGYVLQADVFDPEQKDGLFLLCSDGISDALDEKTVSSVVQNEQDLWNASGKLVQLASEIPGSDNATAILIQIRR